MPLSYKARRRWSLFVLLVGLPIYVAALWFLLSLLEAWPVWAQIAVCLVFSIVWALPLKSVFLGIGQADPDAGRSD